MEVRKLYMNPLQRGCYMIAAHDTAIVAGRRSGKTHGIKAPWLLRNVQHMPRSTGGIVGATFQQLLTRTLPGTIAALEDMGYKRGVHFFVGVKPPQSAGFAKPLREPVSYDRVVSWYNGAIQILISQDVPGSSNSLTLQYVSGDEAKFLNFEKLKDETFPANGGFPGPWRDCPWLNSTLFMTDMPTTKKGSWLLSYEDKATPEIVEAIKVCLSEIARLSAAPQSSYTGKQIAHYRKTLAELRSHAVYYKECSSIENVVVLGEKYIRQMKRDLPPLVFMTSILCIKPGKLKDGFYPGLTDAHLYSNFDNAKLELAGYDTEALSELKCRQDGDLVMGEPICIAFDYNANINWLVAGQVSDNKFYTLKSFYVKYNRKLRELVDDFCDYYRYHTPQEVVFYYDTTAVGSNYAVSDDSFATTIRDQFVKNGWRVNMVYLGQPIRHQEKYHMIHEAMRGTEKYPMPMFNEPNNEALLLAMRGAEARTGSRGIEKNKSGEKYAETEENPLELRTDGTDAWDTLFIGVAKAPYRSAGGGGSMYIG